MEIFVEFYQRMYAWRCISVSILSFSRVSDNRAYQKQRKTPFHKALKEGQFDVVEPILVSI